MPTPHRYIINTQTFKVKAGFALVATISIMVLLVMIALAMLSLSSIELRSSSQNAPLEQARANAQLALMTALAELQASAGPDQRSTATGDLVLGDDQLSDERRNWVGVWDTSEYYPNNPNEKKFIKWLVSSQNQATKNQGSPQDVTINNTYLIFEGNGNSPSVGVDKIPIIDVSGDSLGSYAYWVSDEGMKADIAWSDVDFSDSDRQQSAKLSAGYGPDSGVFSGKSSPLSEKPTEEFLSNLHKVMSLENLSLANNQFNNYSEWLKTYHHDITVGSYGVLADMKLGGLKTDLSLAFEMDDQADTDENEQPENFNQQIGEFVAGSDRLGGSQAADGSIIAARYLYRDIKEADSIYSSDIARNHSEVDQPSVRGPNWWALRDYYNLYKRLTSSNGQISLNSRAYYPNNHNDNINEAPYNLTELTRTDDDVGNGRAGRSDVSNKGTNAWNAEIANFKGGYIYRPAKGRYAPVCIGTLFFVSLKKDSSNNNAQFILDPLLIMWNPYNRIITTDSLIIENDSEIPGEFSIELESEVSNDAIEETIHGIVNGSVGGSDWWGIAYELPQHTMEPGEILAFSASAGDSTNITTNSQDKSFRVPVSQGYNYNENSGLAIDLSDIQSEFAEISTDDRVGVKFAFNNPTRYFRTSVKIGSNETQCISFLNTNASDSDLLDSSYLHESDTPTWIESSELNGKVLIGAGGYLAKPVNDTAPVETFSQFNPIPIMGSAKRFNTRVDPNYTFRIFNSSDSPSQAFQSLGFDFPENSVTNLYWGTSFTSEGSTHIPILNIPSSPLLSIAQFSHANLSVSSIEPLCAVGNSLASPFVPKTNIYGTFTDTNNPQGVNSADHSWLLNDALFDNYYLSGITPDFTLSSGEYNKDGSLEDTLTIFYNEGTQQAKINPSLVPHKPKGKDTNSIIEELIETSVENPGYNKIGAYSLVKGQFNVNSTSTTAWAAMLRSNKGLDLTLANGGETNADESTTPFPSSTSPVEINSAPEHWSGLSYLSDDDIDKLAASIVAEVKERGPFMSLSDFVNRRLSDDQLGDMGALQAAIEDSGINQNVLNEAGGIIPNYSHAGFGGYYTNSNAAGNRRTTTGIPGDITQANILMQLAPRMNARSDTFKIRAYGESSDGKVGVTCEALVQRFPEYMDPTSNDQWDEDYQSPPLPYTTRPEKGNLTSTNSTYGRRFKIVSFKWLAK